MSFGGTLRFLGKAFRAGMQALEEVDSGEKEENAEGAGGVLAEAAREEEEATREEDWHQTPCIETTGEEVTEEESHAQRSEGHEAATRASAPPGHSPLK